MDMCGIEDLMANTVLVQAKSDNAHNKKWRKNFVLPTISDTSDTLKKLEIELCNLMPDAVRMDPTQRKRFEFGLFCEKQCIGKEMFKQFCKTAESKIRNANALMDAIWDFEVANESEREDAARCVANSYLLVGAPYEIHIISDSIKKACTSVILSEEPPKYDTLKDLLADGTPRKSKGEDIDSQNLSLHNALQGNKPDLVVTHLSGTEKRFFFIKLLLEQCKHQIYPFLVDEVFAAYKKSEQFKTFLRWKAKEKEPVIEEDFFPFRLLGRGGFGEVYAYQVKSTGKMYACKKIDKKKMKQKHAEKVVMAEKITLEMVNSPFVVSLSYAYENKNHLNLVMTLMGAGDLKFHIYEKTGDKKRGISAERTKFYTAQITLGLDHLHAENILYRDMKPENVLLDDKGNVRIADLGLVAILGEGEKTSGRAGTVGFMAPEMLESKKYAYGVDWFALGCTIFEMVEGKGPFVSRGKNKRKMSIGATIEKTIYEEHTYKRIHDDDLLDLIDQLLEKDVNQRLAGDEKSAEPIKRHPYFSDINWERLEAGLMPAPFVPDPNQVYAKDVSDIRLGSEAKGITLTNDDKDFHKKFASGRVPIPWQQEMMETGLFQEVMDRKPGEQPKTGGTKKSSICRLL